MISKEEVQKIAKLARIELTEDEIQGMQKDLSEILDYFKLLQKAPKSSHSLASGQAPDNFHLRVDEAGQSNLAEKIVVAAPDKKDGYIKVKTIL